ncbi:hypothetical protein CerSpe_071110 [Prunus speciosa]
MEVDEAYCPRLYCPLHLRGSGAPQSFGFPSKAEVLKLWNWVPVSIGPSRLLYEALNSFKKLRLTNDDGIIPDK